MKDKNNCSHYSALIHGTWENKENGLLYSFTLEKHKEIKGYYDLFLIDPKQRIEKQCIPYNIISENNSCFMVLFEKEKIELKNINLSIEIPIMTMKNTKNVTLTFFKLDHIVI